MLTIVVVLIVLISLPLHSATSEEITYVEISVKADMAALEDEDPNVREHAVYSLAKNYADFVWNQHRAASMESREDDIWLEFDDDKFISERLYIAIEEIRSILARDNCPEVRVAALRFLTTLPMRYIKRHDVRELISTGAGDEETIVRTAAMFAIGNIIYDFPYEHRHFLDFVVINGLKDSDRNVRLSAVRALGFIPSNQGIYSAALKALDDEEFEIRFAAAMALGGDRETLEIREDRVKVFIEGMTFPALLMKAIAFIPTSTESVSVVIPLLLEVIYSKPTSPTTLELLSEIGPEDDVIEMLSRKKPDSILLARLEHSGADWVEARRYTDTHR